ncbi:hypothetical protein YC2023_085754 [Brassica napus]
MDREICNFHKCAEQYYYGWSLGVLNMLFQGGIYRVLRARIGHHSYIDVAGPAWLQSMLAQESGNA